MAIEYKCPLLNMVINETICYDVQMVSGPGSLINKSILDDYNDLFDASKVTDKAVEKNCTYCPFNQLKQPAKNSAWMATAI